MNHLTSALLLYVREGAEATTCENAASASLSRSAQNNIGTNSKVIKRRPTFHK